MKPGDPDFSWPEAFRYDAGSIMPVCHQVFVFVQPYIAGTSHAQRIENRFPHECIQAHSGNVLDDFMQVNKTFAGIAESLAWGEVNLESFAGMKFILQATGVAEYHARGNLSGASVTFHKASWKVLH
jgi:hypothetical protein